MVRVGQILITIGFLIGSLAAVISATEINWSLFVVGMTLGVIGVLVAQIGMKRAATHEDTVATNIEAIGTSLESLVQCAVTLESEKEGLLVYDVHARIDELFPPHLDTFVQARESLIHAFSMQQYADLMNHFAAGERTINRVWSASVDGYIDEVHTCITRALEHFQNARSKFESLQQAAA